MPTDFGADFGDGDEHIFTEVFAAANDLEGFGADIDFCDGEAVGFGMGIEFDDATDDDVF